MLTNIGQGASIKITGLGEVNSTTEEVIVGIRPEDLRITDEAGENRLPCRITELIEGITTYTCRLQVLDSPTKTFHLEAEQSKAIFAPLEVGKECYVWLPSNRMFLTSKH
jgi:ABC-type sugar transport system ATPase subunit